MSLKRRVNALERLVGRKREDGRYLGPLCCFSDKPGKFFRTSEDDKDLIEVPEDQIHPECFCSPIVVDLDPRGLF